MNNSTANRENAGCCLTSAMDTVTATIAAMNRTAVSCVASASFAVNVKQFL